MKLQPIKFVGRYFLRFPASR